MSYNGSGTFQINTTGQPVVTGTVISSTAFNALTADLATGLSTAITKDGQTATTARIPFAAGISSTLVTDSSSTSTGSIITAGGIGVAKAAYIGTTLNVASTTTLTGVATLTANPVLSAGSANGVTYLNGSKSLTSGTGLVFDGTNLGIGVTPSAWATVTPVLQINTAAIYGYNNKVSVSANYYFSTGNKYIQTGYATQYEQDAGKHVWYNAPSGTAGNTITFTQAMTLDASGRLGIGVTSPTRLLDMAAATGNAISFLSATTGTNTAYYAASNTGGGIYVGRENSAGTTFGTTVAYASVLWSEGAYPLIFATSNAERMRIDSSGNVLINTTTAQTGAKLAVTGGIQGTITSGTAVASTSGTSIDFTGIPSWVKRITVMFSGVSTNGTSAMLVQLGTSGGITATGYSAGSKETSGTGSAYTTGFGIQTANVAAIIYGQMVFTYSGSNLWTASHALYLSQSGTSYFIGGGGSITLSGTLDRVRLTTVNGTDTFDAGSVNILYEG
jgi:hypothetical protein